MNFPVHCFETIVVDAIRNCEILRLQREVVPAYLRESRVGHIDERSFTFDQEEGQRIARKDHDVGAFGQCIVVHAGFHREEGFGVAIMRDE